MAADPQQRPRGAISVAARSVVGVPPWATLSRFGRGRAGRSCHAALRRPDGCRPDDLDAAARAGPKAKGRGRGAADRR